MARPNGICPRYGNNTTTIWRRYPIPFHDEDFLDENEIPEYCPTVKRYEPYQNEKGEIKYQEYEDIDDFIIGNYCSRCREIFPWRIQSSGKQEWSESERGYLEKMKKAGMRFPTE
jgi:hypothetical protein